MTVTEQLVLRPLFGGALEISCPERFQDVSDFRPVPDHQEVFADGATDQSLLVEIVDRIDAADDQVGRLAFEDIAEVNEATSSSIASVEPLGQEQVPGVAGAPDSVALLVTGEQVVAKVRQGPEAANQVDVLLAVVRLPQVQSEVLISLNVPVFISQQSSSAQQAGAGWQAGAGQARALFLDMLRTFRVLDYGLFGGHGS